MNILNQKISLFCVLASLLIASISLGQSANDAFQNGLKQFSAGQIQEAEASFVDALRLDPENADILVNLGIINSSIKEFGKSIAYLKSALALDPENSVAKQALLFTESQLEVKEIPHRVTYWESYRSSILSGLSLPVLLVFFAIVTFLFFWRFLELAKARRTARDEEGAPPEISSIIYASGTVLLVCLIVLITKFVDLADQRAIVLPKKVAALSGPAQDAVELFDLFQGLEVSVKRQSSGWTQITYPGGSSGWVPSSALQNIQRIYNQ